MFVWLKSASLCLLGILVVGGFSWFISRDPISNESSWYIGQIFCGIFIGVGCILFLMGCIGALSHASIFKSRDSEDYLTIPEDLQPLRSSGPAPEYRVEIDSPRN